MGHIELLAANLPGGVDSYVARNVARWRFENHDKLGSDKDGAILNGQRRARAWAKKFWVARSGNLVVSVEKVNVR